jgi:hypothetical protein
MTDLRFGTEIGQSRRVIFRNTASAGGSISHEVTTGDTPERQALGHGDSRAVGVGSPTAAGVSTAVERGQKPHGGWGDAAPTVSVGDGSPPGSTGSTPWSAADAVRRLLRKQPTGQSKHRRGGRKPNGRAGEPRRGKGQESIGSGAYLTVDGRKRTLGRSKALKSQALACRKQLQTTFREP